MTTINKFIKERRLAAGLTVEELANMANISSGNLSDIENNKVTNPTNRTLSKIFVALAGK